MADLEGEPSTHIDLCAGVCTQPGHCLWLSLPLPSRGQGHRQALDEEQWPLEPHRRVSHTRVYWAPMLCPPVHGLCQPVWPGFWGPVQEANRTSFSGGEWAWAHMWSTGPGWAGQPLGIG